jgi:hypothetical protein
MPKRGYWIECVPIHSVNSQDAKDALSKPENHDIVEGYRATAESFPELLVMAPSPDKAIEKLREHLKSVRNDYQKTGKILPDLDNPVRPPQKLRQIQGWISVYVDITSTTGCDNQQL